jgi:hypothetical protein
MLAFVTTTACLFISEIHLASSPTAACRRSRINLLAREINVACRWQPRSSFGFVSIEPKQPKKRVLRARPKNEQKQIAGVFDTAVERRLTLLLKFYRL